MAEVGDNSKIEIDFKDLSSVCERMRKLKKSVSESTGKLRAELSKVLDSRGWHNGALATIRKIDDMSPTTRADFLRTFEPMYSAMLEGSWRDQMTDLIPDEPKN